MAGTFYRSILLYLLLIAAIRLMGKRQLGEMEPSEFVVTMVIADLAAVPMQDPEISIWSGILPIITVLCIELLLSTLSYYSITFRKIFCGRPVILMENGQIIQRNLRRTRLTPDELTEHLREKDIVDLTTVKYAILETNGQISALLYPEFQPLTPHDAHCEPNNWDLPITIISGGKLLRSNLKLAGRDENWLHQFLDSRGCTIEQVFLLTLEPSGRMYFTLRS